MSMDSPFKRRRIAGSSYPEIDLNARRAQNDFRLKSIFESIFEKYGKNFDGIGDEIDLETGEIVVNHGHIQSMTNERDTGELGCLSQRLGDSDHEDERSLIEYTQAHSVSLGSSKAGDASLVDNADASEQSDFVADSLIGEVPDQSHLHQLGKKSRRALSIPSDNEEDELASSDIEWASCNKTRLGVQDRFGTVKENFAFLEEPATDPVWRAPPLPNITRLEREGKKVALTSVDDTREYSDDERAGISLWTPEVRKHPVRKQVNANPSSQRSLSFVHDHENNTDEVASHSSDSEPTSRKLIKWNQEEEELLTHLKTTTNLTYTEMTSYFPERQRNSIASHWTYMVTRGKAGPKPPVPTLLRRRIPLPSLSSSTERLGSDRNRLKPCNCDTTLETNEPQTIQQQFNGGFAGAASLAQSSTKPVAHIGGHHINLPCQVSGDHRTLADDAVWLPDDVRAHVAHSMGEQLPSAKDSACNIAESECQVNSKVIQADANQSCGVSRPFGIEEESSLRGKHCTSKLPDQALEVVFKHGCGAWESSASTSTKTEPVPNGGASISDGIVPSEIHSWDATVIEASNSPRQGKRSITEAQCEKSIPPTPKDAIKTTGLMSPGLSMTRSATLVSTTPAEPPDRCKSTASHERNVDGTSENSIKRQIVQVVIPLSLRSQPHSRLPLATTETEDAALNGQLSPTVDNAYASLGSSLPHQENVAIYTPTRSPSVAAAESQYAASAASVHDGVRTSLGPEIADSQPLSTIPVVATPMPALGEDVTRPIILDAESPPSAMNTGVAPSAGEQLEEVTKSIILDCHSQPLRVTSVMATPARKLIEEATESDILESGSHLLTKPTSATRSLSKRAKKGNTAETSSSVWPAIDDCSEDELSYL